MAIKPSGLNSQKRCRVTLVLLAHRLPIQGAWVCRRPLHLLQETRSSTRSISQTIGPSLSLSRQVRRVSSWFGRCTNRDPSAIRPSLIRPMPEQCGKAALPQIGSTYALSTYPIPLQQKAEQPTIYVVEPYAGSMQQPPNRQDAGSERNQEGSPDCIPVAALRFCLEAVALKLWLLIFVP